MKRKLFYIAASLLLVSACQSKAAPDAVATIAPTTVTLIPTLPTSTSIPPTRILTAQPSLRISPIDGMTQIYVPAGIVKMGGLDIFSENDEKPVHVVQLDAFWIDQVEVTNGMYGLCVQTGNCRKPEKLNSDNRANYFSSPEFKDYPVVYVTWLDAKTYCEWAGRRLLTEAEWERAARGDDMRTYPWGDDPPTADFANFNNELGDTSRVGSYAAGASSFGVLDMAGNVWEWISDYYDSNYYQVSVSTNPTGPADRVGKYNRVIRGGSFQDSFVNLRVSNRGYELGPDPSELPNDSAYYGHSSVKIGFRCGTNN